MVAGHLRHKGANPSPPTGIVVKHLKDQMAKILLFQCNCNILTVLPKRTILPKTA